jgi:hypothetical protein
VSGRRWGFPEEPPSIRLPSSVLKKKKNCFLKQKTLAHKIKKPVDQKINRLKILLAKS